jgi:hypothetical protein
MGRSATAWVENPTPSRGTISAALLRKSDGARREPLACLELVISATHTQRS